MTPTDQLKTTALILHPAFRRHGDLSVAENAASSSHQSKKRTSERRLEEACGLARAIDLEIIDAHIITGQAPRPSTLLGKGKVDEIASLIRARDIELVIIDAQVSPVQQRNLERAWKAKVLDRTALILEIFGERAATKEGRLQVDLAHLTYQRSRLVRSWTHLERQRGGVGFLGGPGETQIEADRRVLLEKITKLKRELETVRRTRKLHRSARKKVPYPIVALVGYTNAGKSTLFNRLTDADVFAEDLLFATLDPTMRALDLPSGIKIILSDTVGFISNLPTQLVAAFRATLEEVVAADVIVHVRDMSDPDTEAQKEDVAQILEDLLSDGEAESRAPVIELQNKIDLLNAEQRALLPNGTISESEPHFTHASADYTLPVSALNGEYVDRFLHLLDDIFSQQHKEMEIDLPASAGEPLAWLYAHADILERQDTDGGEVRLKVRMSEADFGRYEKRFMTA